MGTALSWSPTAPVGAQIAPPVTEEPAFEEPFIASDGQPTSARAARPITVGGPAVSVATEQGAPFVFTAAAGRTITVQTDRFWTLSGPLGNAVSTASTGAFTLQDTGRYLLSVDPGLKPPLIVRVLDADPSAVITRVNPGDPITLSTTETRPQVTRVPLRGGQRYHLVVPAAQTTAQFCVAEDDQLTFRTLGCAIGQASRDGIVSFVLDADREVEVTGTWTGGADNRPATVSAGIVAAPNDLLVDTTANPVVDLEPKPGQSVVVPYWGSPAQRSVISSIVAADVSGWGQPWIDREEGGPVARQKVFAVPVTFNPGAPAFVSWFRSLSDPSTQRRRIGFYRGEENAVDVPATGEPVKVRNSPWFAAVGSLSLDPGSRYAVQITGTNIRPVSLAVRDPSGKFTSGLSPWQWTEEGGIQRALTTMTADRGGRWAVEIRPEGNVAREFQISLARIGAGGSYKALVESPDVLTVGEETDITLAPNEFARVTVKLTSATPQIVQPEVLRFRNRTFQPTAADLSLWDSKGRLVWSNNRNLEEEVLSGRLGREPELSERFATVASTDPYTLVIDPKSDVSGRFRLSVKSSAVLSDVHLGTGAVPILLTGTRTGVVEVREPTRFRLSGARACLASTSLVEWGGPIMPPGSVGGSVTATTAAVTLPPLGPTTTIPSVTTVPAQAPPGRPVGGRCLGDGTTLSLPPGVHRFAFSEPVTRAASFDVVAPGQPPDPVVDVLATIDGPAVTLPAGEGFALVRFDAPTAGTRVLIIERISDGQTTVRSPVSAVVRRPDGIRLPRPSTLTTELAGRYTALIARNPSGSRSIEISRAPAEVQAGTLAVGAKFKLFTLRWGQRLEATVPIARRTRVDFDTFGGVQFLYAADASERRYSADGTGTVVLPPGSYRFVFVGEGGVRITLLRARLELGSG